MNYTKETLTSINARYLSEHWLSDSDVQKINTLSASIEKKREGEPIPQDGDILICVRPDGSIITESAHLEKASWADEGEITACVQVYNVPHITSDGKCDASGGPWRSVKPSDLTYVGKRVKTFWTWGHMGGCRNGGVHFQAEVNVWNIVDERNRF